MATDSSVPITAGSGTPIDAIVLASGDYQQVIREARATAATTNTWTIATTASTSQIAADPVRLKMLMVHIGQARVWLRFDATAPTALAHHWFIDPGERFEVPEELTGLAVSMLGQGVGGTIVTLLSGAN